MYVCKVVWRRACDQRIASSTPGRALQMGDRLYVGKPSRL